MSITVIESAEAVPRGNGLWDYVSASRLNLWLRCPLAFKLRYIDGIRSPTSPSLFLGKVVHAGLETFYRHQQVGVRLAVENIVQGMEARWAVLIDEEQMVFSSVEEETASRKQAADLITAYLRQVDADEPKPLAVETTLELPLVDPFTGEDLGIPLLGVVDLVLDGSDGPLVVDFKTAARGNNPVELLHEVQLSAYSWLFRRTAGRAESGLEIRSLVKTKVPKLESHRYAARCERHFRRFFRLVRAYLDDLDSGRFVYRPGLHCSLCEFRERCAAWDGD